jgi:hypothetical protein
VLRYASTKNLKGVAALLLRRKFLDAAFKLGKGSQVLE